MQFLKMLSLSAALIMLLATYGLSYATNLEQQDATDQETAYSGDDNDLIDVRKDAINNKKNTPGALQIDDSEFFNEEERRALTKGTTNDVGDLKKFKPALNKPKLAAPLVAPAPK